MEGSRRHGVLTRPCVKYSPPSNALPSSTQDLYITFPAYHIESRGHMAAYYQTFFNLITFHTSLPTMSTVPNAARNPNAAHGAHRVQRYPVSRCIDSLADSRRRYDLRRIYLDDADPPFAIPYYKNGHRIAQAYRIPNNTHIKLLLASAIVDGPVSLTDGSLKTPSQSHRCRIDVVITPSYVPVSTLPRIRCPTVLRAVSSTQQPTTLLLDTCVIRWIRDDMLGALNQLLTAGSPTSLYTLCTSQDTSHVLVQFCLDTGKESSERRYFLHQIFPVPNRRTPAIFCPFHNMHE